MENFEKLKEKVALMEADVVKFEAGNKAAGTRVRVGMQVVKALAQACRLEVQKGA